MAKSRDVKRVIRVSKQLVICHGAKSMFIPDPIGQVRQVYLELPPYESKPTVTATIYSEADPGNVFGVTGVTFEIDVADFQSCKVTAQTASNTTMNEYICNFVVMGIPKKMKTKRARKLDKAERKRSSRKASALQGADELKPAGRKSKYEPLASFLTSQAAGTNVVTLSFRQIEDILGAKLPESAFTYREWWSNQADTSTRPQARSWMSVGFEVETVNQDRTKGSVRFKRKFDLHA
jgi:hypothetical protein